MRLLSLAVFAAALSAAPAHADCLDDFKTILAAPLSAGPYALESTKDGASFTAEIVSGAVAHIRYFRVDSVEEATWIEGRVWIKRHQVWALAPEDKAPSIELMFPTAMLDHVGSAECLGTQPFDGRDYLAFSADLPGPDMAATIYADPTTLLPAVLTVFTVHGAAREMALVTTYRYRYDPTITVSAPM